MTVEFVPTEWFDKNAIKLPNYKVGRVNFGKGRSYIKIEPDGQLAQPFRLYTSLTTSIAQSMPTPFALEDWKFMHGKKEADRLMKVAAHYGTLMHMEIGRFIKEGVYDLDAVQDPIDNYLSDNNFWDNDCTQWPDKLKEDMLAFVKFYNDYEVIPLGLEYVLLSEKRGFGTPIDLVCMLMVDEKGEWGEVYKSGERKGEPKVTSKRVQKRAIINFKSGRKGFYETHGIQMECERLLWDENFPESPIDIAMNWAPADWRTTPDYKIKEWQGTTPVAEIEAILKLAEIRYAARAEKKAYMNMTGIISTAESVAGAVQFEDIEDFCNRKFGNTPNKKRTHKLTEAKQAALPKTFVSSSLPI
ncbi:MAG: hypothetical protein EOO20_01720 [Chryseobacterium sp.]|nr:MAG: hypothetical protein EOO20_01720 [Chryseobacterium sp.]